MQPGTPALSRTVACDESGYEGEKLVGGETDVFAHAGVVLTAESASTCIQELRRRIRSPALEYKANHLLRGKHRSVLEWLLGPSGPIHGHAHVQLVDKTAFLVGAIVDAVGCPRPDAARILCRAGRHTFERDPWLAFLVSANDLMRSRHRQRPGVESVHGTVDDLLAAASGDTHDVLRWIRDGAAHLHPDVDDPVPALDLLVPAIVRTVRQWSGEGPVVLLHDRQTALTETRLAWIRENVAGRMRGLTLVDSRSDPRIQVADFLAGVARKVASDELAGRGDAVLLGLLRPYVDTSATAPACAGRRPSGSSHR